MDSNSRKCIKFDSNLVCYLPNAYIKTIIVYFETKQLQKWINSYFNTH